MLKRSHRARSNPRKEAYVSVHYKSTDVAIKTDPCPAVPFVPRVGCGGAADEDGLYKRTDFFILFRNKDCSTFGRVIDMRSPAAAPPDAQH